MKKIIIILLVLLLLGGGAAGYFFLFRDNDAAAEKHEAPAPKAGEFVEIDPVSLPVIRGGKVSKLVTFRIVLELGPARRLDEVRPNLPRLVDASLVQLASLAALDWPHGAVLDAEVARHRLLQRFRQIVPGDLIAGVLIRDVLERPS